MSGSDTIEGILLRWVGEAWTNSVFLKIFSFWYYFRLSEKLGYNTKNSLKLFADNLQMLTFCFGTLSVFLCFHMQTVMVDVLTCLRLRYRNDTPFPLNTWFVCFLKGIFCSNCRIITKKLTLIQCYYLETLFIFHRLFRIVLYNNIKNPRSWLTFSWEVSLASFNLNNSCPPLLFIT